MTQGASHRILAPYLLAGAALLALAAWAVLHLAEPAPPKVVVMSTGPLDGAYHAFALRYQAYLAQYGVTLELRPSAGSVENVERLKARQDGVSLALVQGGIANAENAPGLVTLGSMFYEPNWIFYRSKTDIDLGNQLRGKRIAIGAPGSGTRAFGLVAVARHRPRWAADCAERTRRHGGGEGAGGGRGRRGVLSRRARCARRAAPAGRTREWLLGAKRAEAFARRMPHLHKLTLPEGAADLARNIPPRDLAMLAVTANLVAVEDIHPVIVDLLLEAAKKVHGGDGLFQRVGEFPAPRDLDLPLSPDAERFYKASPSILRRYLPFWMVMGQSLHHRWHSAADPRDTVFPLHPGAVPLDHAAQDLPLVRRIEVH
jgi:hypothetical protein